MYKLNGKTLDENQIGGELISCIEILLEDSRNRLEKHLEKTISFDKTAQPEKGMLGLVADTIVGSLEATMKSQIKKESKKQSAFLKNKDIKGLVKDTQLSLDLMGKVDENTEKMYESIAASGLNDYYQIKMLKTYEQVLINAVRCFECQLYFCAEYFHSGVENEQ